MVSRCIVERIYNLCFVSRAKENPQEIYEYEINRERFSLTDMGWLSVAYKTPVSYELITPQDNPLLFYQ